MSLRVLLADESASIRKVFQMGLQDYGAEVKSVHNGLDVIEVAEKFKPDIIFADILLQKKNGYEVSKEVGEHDNLASVPVVLMWSSFMELDRAQYKDCGAQGELEKPFDVEAMRTTIQNLVGQTQSQMISSFLKFPDSITEDFQEEEEKKSKNPQPASPSPTSEPISEPAEPMKLEEDDESPVPQLALEEEEDDYKEEASFFNTQALDDEDESENEEEFNMYEVPSATQIKETKEEATSQKSPISASPEEDDIQESWQARPLNHDNFAGSEEPEPEDQEDNFQSMNLNEDKKLDLNEFLYRPEKPAPPAPKPERRQAPPEKDPSIKVRAVNIPDYEDTMISPNSVSPEETEAIIRSETRAFLMSYVQKEFPNLLEKIVRQELEKVVQQELALKETPSEP